MYNYLLNKSELVVLVTHIIATADQVINSFCMTESDIGT